ncbi:MAG: hypothetical protein DSO07_05140 [Thermoproteota archaeon]|nr:MAG: hypothetical protein DSO07_05140 [Candidatus Korarchaeota archaeon]
MSSIDDLISSLENIVSTMRYVKPGDEIRAEDINSLIRYTKTAVELIKAIYDLFVSKTGKKLPTVESYISIAEMRSSYLKEVMSLEVIYPDNYNMVIDTLKPIELALIEIEKNI